MLRKPIDLDTSDKKCLKHGFHSGDTAMNRNNNKVIMAGVAKGYDGRDKLWYEIVHPAIHGRVCYWNGGENLKEEDFVLLT